MVFFAHIGATELYWSRCIATECDRCLVRDFEPEDTNSRWRSWRDLGRVEIEGVKETRSNAVLKSVMTRYNMISIGY